MEGWPQPLTDLRKRFHNGVYWYYCEAESAQAALEQPREMRPPGFGFSSLRFSQMWPISNVDVSRFENRGITHYSDGVLERVLTSYPESEHCCWPFHGIQRRGMSKSVLSNHESQEWYASFYKNQRLNRCFSIILNFSFKIIQQLK